jgi:hypothetical protein
MTPEQFAYWLQGFVELTQGQTPNPAQWKSIQAHLNTVFNKVTPPVEVPNPGIDWKKIEENLRKGLPDQRVAPPGPFIPPHQQPAWVDNRYALNPNQFPPGTIIC